MKYLVVATAMAGFALQTTNAQAGCCAPDKKIAQTTSTAAQAATKTVGLDIEGMTCGSCAASVKTALEKLDGVRNVQISSEQKGGTVEFDAAKVSEAKIVEAVNNAGFKAQQSKDS
ncbi:MAG TPA: heavy-metal-associated domain-containing protein [Chthoniobacterales bacterium]|nr:heavy-metal-associated domain-containing protein [Chthoniobacterales bacterium]